MPVVIVHTSICQKIDEDRRSRSGSRGVENQNQDLAKGDICSGKPGTGTVELMHLKKLGWNMKSLLELDILWVIGGLWATVLPKTSRQAS